jgi:endonuclease YncB( thermonuclease family)
MKSLILAIVYLFFTSTSVFSAGMPGGFPNVIQGNVIRVLDGDTIDVLQDTKTVRIRLANIDAPEKKQPFGSWSTSQLKKLITGQTVTVTYTQTDRYGRVLGRVVTDSGIEANRFMVQVGAAWVYEQYNTEPSYPSLQREAEVHKRGLWADSNPIPPWEWRHSNLNR